MVTEQTIWNHNRYSEHKRNTLEKYYMYKIDKNNTDTHNTLFKTLQEVNAR